MMVLNPNRFVKNPFGPTICCIMLLPNALVRYRPKPAFYRTAHHWLLGFLRLDQRNDVRDLPKLVSDASIAGAMRREAWMRTKL